MSALSLSAGPSITSFQSTAVVAQGDVLPGPTDGLDHRQLHCWLPTQSAPWAAALSVGSAIHPRNRFTNIAACKSGNRQLLADGTVASETFEFLVSRSDQSHIKQPPPPSWADTALDIAAAAAGYLSMYRDEDEAKPSGEEEINF